MNPKAFDIITVQDRPVDIYMGYQIMGINGLGCLCVIDMGLDDNEPVLNNGINLSYAPLKKAAFPFCFPVKAYETFDLECVQEQLFHEVPNDLT